MQIAIALATCTPTLLSYVMARILTQTLLQVQQLCIRNCKQSPALILKSSTNTNTHSRPNLLDLVTNLSHNPPHSLSFSTSRGWPCFSTFFLLNHHEDGSAQPNEDLESKESAETETELDIEVKVSDDMSRSENEED
ncbi:hypothetical protein CFP56_032807 [Quercus suber]|uniref:Uncharacterized protein n=1 Tax=Quercus suber TaxID=58331 RepID=A0AAW0JFL0_QUESU